MTRREDDELAADWHDRMRQYHDLVCKLDRELGAAHGLSSSEFEALQQLAAAKPDGRMRMADLAGHVHLTQSALSRLVGRLEKEGLVTRDMCADDRRSVWTMITAEGRERFREARSTQRTILRVQAAGCAKPSIDERR